MPSIADSSVASSSVADSSGKNLVAARKAYRKTLKNLAKRNKEGKILCPRGCSSTFTSNNNMYIHVENEVCTKPVSERSVLRCKWSNCSFTCVTQGNLKNHHLGHLDLKDYVCEICGKDFAHGSSLTNHKHGLHSDIYPPPADWIAKQGDKSKTKHSSGEIKKKKTKKAKDQKEKKRKKDVKKKDIFSSTD